LVQARWVAYALVIPTEIILLSNQRLLLRQLAHNLRILGTAQCAQYISGCAIYATQDAVRFGSQIDEDFEDVD
jgi:hypothetical protein